LRERQKRCEDDEENTTSYRITLMKKDYIRILKSIPFLKGYGLVTRQTTNDN